MRRKALWPILLVPAAMRVRAGTAWWHEQKSGGAGPFPPEQQQE
jgi:hypothetical protein